LPSVPAPQPVSAPMSVVPNSAPRLEDAAPLASPAVRAQARERGIDLGRVAGTGPGGRIMQGDLDAAIAASGAGEGAPGQADAGPPQPCTTEIKVVGLRRRIAERMAQSNARVAHITVVEEVDVTALEDLRAQLNA